MDIKAQQEVINLIKNEKNKNNTKSYLISIHDLNQALTIGDKFVFLKNGRVYGIYSKEQIDEKIIEDVYGVKVEIINKNGRRHVIYEN